MEKFKVFDSSGFIDVCCHDSNLEQDLLNAITDNLKSAKDKLQSIVNQRDVGHLKAHLHQLKGTLGGLGQTKLYDLVKSIEANGPVYNQQTVLLIYSLLERISLLAEEMRLYIKMKQNVSN